MRGLSIIRSDFRLRGMLFVMQSQAGGMIVEVIDCQRRGRKIRDEYTKFNFCV